ncbi:adenine nucleotide alpha hydrolase [Encephalitozoon hellem ATCC 50504]|uniref:Cytoplasmic tRNA 2-thiolation protein 1 n=1 Tax=Encephalitozoon hellem TaxID=27973 RepID=A0A9Q9C7G5_ENCHE|nr:adenine nucleotide alpha hydrolase [Encephalitozoon hellem ATCC 50504]AFM98011.1 adenine nucleotide alpha hydrolase [Encephalitozoon hellem ATCC 50504]UTX42815.1 tRNA-5-methyluridine(54) 2-sulfurtransferase TtuA [Encephalitozoon hellem]WEL38274.1 tRNA-5-methyluridine(54) 2-sulfurtransferase TtuA [Encephalitozoon hellem]|eukprot:XP_003886992.1 adenine nucleotide alpha hydrolase [Encephalitozoon hellem ATCC 50504]
MACMRCNMSQAIVIRAKDRTKVCKSCFFKGFEADVHETITSSGMLRKGDRVGVGMSGGKDSTVLAYVLDLLNKRHGYGVELVLLSVDEGIAGYRDQSIVSVCKNSARLGLELKIVSFEELFGTTMDNVVQKIGRKGNCTYCGVFRRQALEDAAKRMGVNVIATGHNADDVAETVLLNIIRGDISRLRRCTLAKTRPQSNGKGEMMSLSRLKPFKHIYQKEIVLYAFHKKLEYFSTECTYSLGASRGDLRMLVKQLEREDPKVILNVIRSGDMLQEEEPAHRTPVPCTLCGHSTSSHDAICNGCTLVRKLRQYSA